MCGLIALLKGLIMALISVALINFGALGQSGNETHGHEAPSPASQATDTSSPASETAGDQIPADLAEAKTRNAATPAPPSAPQPSTASAHHTHSEHVAGHRTENRISTRMTLTAH